MTTKDNINPNSLFSNITSDKLPPVDTWNPPYCGEIDLCIHRNGSWSYNGSPISRPAIVNMFARVLKREQDDYFLVTPVEKVKIKVEAEPFITIALEQRHHKPKTLAFETNLNDIIIAGSENPIEVHTDSQGQPYPTILIRKNLHALISRSDFYHLVELSTSEELDGKTLCSIESSGCHFSLGEY